MPGKNNDDFEKTRRISEKTKARIYTARNLKEGSCYTIEDRKFTASHDKPYELYYVGKQGIHFVFKEKKFGWSRTFTLSQLMGKKITKIKEF